jgi:16S rRNA (cytosine967-C5)-methyltransferase
MSVLKSYVLSAQTIIEAYNGSIPFAAWVKNYFKQNKKFGSRDRKNILELCYSFFRLGKAFSILPIEERFLAGLFLTRSKSHPVLEALKPGWNENITLSLNEKAKLIGREEALFQIFPFTSFLSKEIDPYPFSISHLEQPDLFLRARPGSEKKIRQALDKAGVAYSVPAENVFALSSGIKAEEYVNINQDAVVQDLNSQQSLLVKDHLSREAKIKVWDCCAASGGKSLLVFDHFFHSEIWVSDIRESIIANLKKRFSEAGIKNYRSFVADVSNGDFAMKEKFDLVICDAPCSGSGTWGRTPEQLIFFKDDKIDQYSSLQHSIAMNAAKHVKPGGYFLYITCSVFEKENEEQVKRILQNKSFELVEQKYLKGYGKKADTLFAALLRSAEKL